jgi:hypothetical protein
MMIPVCWHQRQKAGELSLFMLEEEQALFQTRFLYINLGRNLEIITIEWTVEIMPAGNMLIPNLPSNFFLAIDSALYFNIQTPIN